MTEMPVENDNAAVEEEAMLTTGEAAKVIGFGTTARQVAAMVGGGQLRAVRLRPGGWARIPLSEVLKLRDQLSEQLTGASTDDEDEDAPVGGASSFGQ